LILDIKYKIEYIMYNNEYTMLGLEIKEERT